MKEALSPSSSPEKHRTSRDGLRLQQLSFLENGPYSLDVSPGECIGLCGRSGVGKTQLLRAVADVIAHGGDSFLDGQACSMFEPPTWRKTVAMVPAESCWWYDTVAPHFGETLQQEETGNWLTRLGFSEDVASWRIARLSTGEKQRLALLRTLSTKPRVLLLDEPTSSLDSKMAQVVEEIVADICFSEKNICLWVSHDREQLFRVAGRVLRVEPHGFEEEVRE